MAISELEWEMGRVSHVASTCASLILVLAPLLSCASCVSAQDFSCKSNLQCVDGAGTQGLCEGNGSCSFPDESCSDSRRRYPDAAAATVANHCVTSPPAECVSQLAGGEQHFCLLETDGSVWCWGSNEHGQLGTDNRNDATAPTRTKLSDTIKVVGIYPGEFQSCALDDKGVIRCWGSNEAGDLGVASGWSVDAQGNDVATFNDGDVLTPQPITDVLEPDRTGLLKRAPAPPFIAMAVGGVHGCALSQSDALYCWGENNHQQCGVDKARFDEGIVPVPTRVLGAPKGIKTIALGDEFSLLLMQDGSVFAFGDNSYGELGNGSQGGESFTPVQVSITAVRELGPGAAHACAEKEDGTIWCWGYGASGALGLGSTENESSPRYVTSARQIASSGNAFHTCAIDITLGLECWGQNSAGALGLGSVSDGQTTWIASPRVVPLVTVTRVATANTATCALTTDQVLWCWGENSHGQLGAGASQSSAVPMPEPVRANFNCP